MVTIAVIFWRWYYKEAAKGILQGWKNFIIFSLEYFSVPLLLKTLISPWKRDITKKPRGFNPGELFTYLSFNAVSRGIGFLVRLPTICVGILFFFATVIIGALFFIIWILLPLIFIGLLGLAFVLIF